MPTYAYKAIEHSGKAVTGSLTAENRQVALRLLDEQSLHPLSVEESRARSLSGRGPKIRLRHLTTCYQQLSDLLRTGVPMMTALDVMSSQDGGSAVLQQILREVREDVAGGATLADALEKHLSVFSDLHCSMIRAGERGGFLEDVLGRLAGFAERQDELRGKLRGAMIYPCILLTAGGLVVTFIMGFVVPKLRTHLPASSLNMMSHLVFGACDALVLHYGKLLAGVVLLVMAIRWFSRTTFGRRRLAIWKLKAPIFGKVSTMVAVSRFCRILGTMLHNGVPILQALKIAKDSAGNEVMAEHIDAAGENVRRGATLSEPLRACGLFPAEILSMIAVAEESNNLETVLVQIADRNEARTARTIDAAVRMVEPLILALMAALVGAILFALLLPILTMGSGIR